DAALLPQRLGEAHHLVPGDPAHPMRRTAVALRQARVAQLEARLQEQLGDREHLRLCRVGEGSAVLDAIQPTGPPMFVPIPVGRRLVHATVHLSRVTYLLAFFIGPADWALDTKRRTGPRPAGNSADCIHRTVRCGWLCAASRR